MRKTIPVLALLLAASMSVQAQSKEQIQHVYDSVVLLYTQTVSGDMKMTCTATAFSATPSKVKPDQTVYRFVSAAHCVDGDDDKTQRLQKFYISSDMAGEKNYLAAKLIEAGDKTQGDDFSLFEVSSTEKFVTLPLGDDVKIHPGDAMIDVSGALGFGKQYYQGYVSEVHLDRPPLDAGEVSWTDLMLIQIGGGPGSSGSAIVSTDQNAIVGFLVGTAKSDVGKLCVPVSKFKDFVSAVDAGKYKKTVVPKHQDQSDEQ